MVNFGAKLLAGQHRPWAEHYMSYGAMKELLERIEEAVQACDKALQDDENREVGVEAAISPSVREVHLQGLKAKVQELDAEFMSALEAELVKVNQFYLEKESELVEATRNLQDERDALDNSAATEAARRRFMSSMEAVNEDITRLRGFADVNYRAFFKILKKHDKVTGLAHLAEFMAKVDHQEFHLHSEQVALDVRGYANAQAVFSDEYKDQLSAELRQAARVFESAISDIRAVMSAAERAELQSRAMSKVAQQLQSLEQHLSQEKGEDTVRHQVLQAKVRMFVDFCAEIAEELQTTFPEGAAVVDRLMAMHSALFTGAETPKKHASFRLPRRGSLSGNESQNAGGASGGGTGAGAGPILVDTTDDRPLGIAPSKSSTRLNMLTKESGGGPSSSKPDGVHLVQRTGIEDQLSKIPLPPIVKLLRNYDWKNNLRSDLIAGLTIAIVVIPQGLGYAILAQLPPVYGIFSAMVPAFMYSLFGTSRQAAVGPMSIPCLLVGASAANFGAQTTAEFVAIASAMAMMVGAITLLMGLFNLGFLVRFIANPVMKGFAAASAVITMLSMVSSLIGVPIARAVVVQDQIPRIIRAIPSTKYLTTILGIICILMILVLREIPARFPKLDRIKYVPPPVIAMITFILVSLTICESNGIDPLQVTPIQGAGTSFGSVFMQQAMQTYQCSHTNLSMSYSVTHLHSINSYSDPVGFVLSGFPLPVDQTRLLRAPVVASAAVPVLNLDNFNVLDVDVVFTCSTLSRVLLGDIRYWDHRDLKADNPVLARTLPHMPIQLVVPSYPSSVIGLITTVLSSCSDKFAETVGAADAVVWPASPSVISTDDVVSTLLATPGGLGFMTIMEIPSSLAVAGFRNLVNATITPSARSVQATVDQFGAMNSTTDGRIILRDPTAVLKSRTAWPFTGFSMLMMPRGSDSTVDGRSCAVATEAAKFWIWFYTSTDVLSTAASYGCALPSALDRTTIVNSLMELRCAATGDILLEQKPHFMYSGFWQCPPGAVPDTTLARSCDGVAILGHIPSGVPIPQIPNVSLSILPRLAVDALLITFVAFMEAISVAKMYAVKNGYQIDPSQELKAIGIANIMGGLFSAFPVMGAFGLSSVNSSSGARTQMSLLFMSVFVVIAVFVVTPALFYLPQAALAAAVVTAVAKLIDIASIGKLWKTDKIDLFVMLVAFLSTCLLGVGLGVVVAMCVSLLMFIYASTTPKTSELGRLRGTVHYRELPAPDCTQVPYIKIVRFFGPLFFANAERLKDVLVEAAHAPDIQVVILDCSNISSIDSSAFEALIESRDALETGSKPRHLILAQPNSAVSAKLELRKWSGIVRPGVHEAVKTGMTLVSKPAPKKDRHLSALESQLNESRISSETPGSASSLRAAKSRRESTSNAATAVVVDDHSEALAAPDPWSNYGWDATTGHPPSLGARLKK